MERLCGIFIFFLWLFAYVGKDSAVNIKDVAVDEVGRVGGEEYGWTHEVVGCAPAGGRCLRNDEAVERMAAAVGLQLAQWGCLWCGDVAGANAVALDVVFAKL